jgi:hypothetical protein
VEPLAKGSQFRGRKLPDLLPDFLYLIHDCDSPKKNHNPFSDFMQEVNRGL